MQLQYGRQCSSPALNGGMESRAMCNRDKTLSISRLINMCNSLTEEEAVRCSSSAIKTDMHSYEYETLSISEKGDK